MRVEKLKQTDTIARIKTIENWTIRSRFKRTRNKRNNKNNNQKWIRRTRTKNNRDKKS